MPLSFEEQGLGLRAVEGFSSRIWSRFNADDTLIPQGLSHAESEISVQGTRSFINVNECFRTRAVVR